jgi:diguanylate cyclase (GGDEF)-like protein
MGETLSLRRRFSRFNIPIAAWPSLLNGTLGLIACVCIALIGTEAWQLWRVYEANIEQTETVTSNTAWSLAKQAENTLKTADTIVSSLVGLVEAEGTGPEARLRLYHVMTSLAEALPAIHEMGITDNHGNAIVKSLVANPTGLNYSEREYFRFHSTHPDRGPFIGERIKSKIDGSTNITLTRRVNNPDGSFAGVVVTSVSMTFFQRLFDQMQANSGGIIAMFGADGTILARSPPFQNGRFDVEHADPALWQKMHEHADAGTVAYLSPFSGAWRHGSYQHLNQFPLTTLVAQSDWDLQTTWRAELRSHAIILACVMIVLVVLGRRAVKATRMLAAQALQDGLTGLANRRSFDETIEREVRRASRSHQPISIILIDVDHFKVYNDCYGHPAGDECLRVVARAIQGCLRRAGEFAARYGGEEIVVLLPGYDAPRAHALAETMRLAVRALAMPQATQLSGVVTFSAGVATYRPGSTSGGPQSLIAAADAGLYAAKAAGRDTVKPGPSPLQIVAGIGAVEALVA